MIQFFTEEIIIIISQNAHNNLNDILYQQTALKISDLHLQMIFRIGMANLV